MNSKFPIYKEIRPQDLGLEIIPDNDYELQFEAVRGIVKDNKGKIAIIHYSYHGYHGLPGGKVKGGESQVSTLSRELSKEIGCTVLVGEYLSLAIEWRSPSKRIKFSYCYLAQVEENFGKLCFSESEQQKGATLLWFEVDEAIEIMERDAPTLWKGKYTRARDLFFLTEAKKALTTGV